MPRVNLEDRFFTDFAFLEVAQQLGIHVHHVRGACAELWHQCQNGLTSTLTTRRVDAIADVAGFASAMVESGLAEVSDEAGNEVRLKGIEQRIDKLLENSEVQRRRAEKKHAKKRGSAGGMPSGSGSGSGLDLVWTGSGSPPTPPVSAEAAAHESGVWTQSTLPGAAVGPKAPRKASPRPATAPPPPKPAISEMTGPGWQAVVDAWWSAFQAASGGVAPTLDERAFGQLRRVVARAKGDTAEVIRRIEILWSSPPTFLAGGMHDPATLDQHWDKLAAPHGGSKLTQSINSRAERARRLLDEERLAREAAAEVGE